MLKEIFTSSPLTYRTEEDLLAALGGDPLPSFHYNNYLLTAPRIYPESLSAIHGIAVVREETADSLTKILIFGLTDQYYYPSYGRWLWKFNGATGELLETVEFLDSLYNYQMFQSGDGSLWQITILGELFEFDLTTLTEVAGTRRDVSDFGLVTITSLITDRVRDFVILCGSGYTDDTISMRVHTFSTGELIRQIYLAGHPVIIMPEDGTRCWVLTDNSILHLVDYDDGTIIKTVSVPVDHTPTVSVGSVQPMCYDPYTRRILHFEINDDATDGQGQSLIRGFYPIPVATYLTEPIPLKQPRKGRVIPVLVRAVGDIGEPISGQIVTLTPSGDISASPSTSSTDSNGDLIANFTCTNEGSATIDASMENGL